MIAPKWSPLWRELSAFGYPFPPFGHWKTDQLEDVDRDEADALGLKVPQSIPEISPLPQPKLLLG